ncbi:MAG: hypothetical protein LBF09_07140 [Odoribacteraceae bacterium]|jgi:hypothetical protein|nr:hypothetical protein [Odoribacteraceae bacterium]
MNKSVFTLSLLLSLLSFRGASGQEDSIPPPVVIEATFLERLLVPDTLTGGEVSLGGDPRVTRLVELMTGVNRRDFSFPGYRVQILSANTARVKLDSLQRYVTRFEELFPGTRAYLQYVDPDFKIRVGNFRAKIDAMPLLRRVRRKYPSSYIVKETILLKDLLEPRAAADDEAAGEEITDSY